MTGPWRVPAEAIVRVLQDVGLTVSMGSTPPARDLLASGDRGATHIEIAVDAAGRVRVTTSYLGDDTVATPLSVGERQFPRVRSTQEHTTVTGEIGSLEELRQLLRVIGLERGA